ncbi:hypothetical protein KY290_031233 [Solanum tuberosum]|uniref:Uncharacterized protein n=1 Tax=Solanum tuberosum TaxID=4113 RepID=A0ABQ7UC14_SOLTU|nr:hypothetical protein KY290_031233 [Solanum tuberosum]
METMVEIDNYQDSSPDESDNVESSEGESNSEESSRDEEDPLSLPICARDISGELYDLATWLDEVGSFRAMISGTCFGHLRHIPDYFKFNGQIVHYMLLRRVWIYEAFPYLGKYAGKSLDTPLPISCLLRWCTPKSNNIVEGDPFKYKGRSTKFVHSYLTPIVRVMEQNYMATFKPYIDEVKDAVINVLKAQLKGVTILTSGVESADDEYLAIDEDLAAVDESFAAIDEYFMDGVDEVAVAVVDKVKGDHVDEVAVDAVDEVAGDVVDEVAGDVVDEVVVDGVAVDGVTGDEVACAVDPVTVVDEVAVDVVDEMAGAVDPVAADVVDEVIVTIDNVAGDEVVGAIDPVTVDIVDEVTHDAIDEVAEE